MRVEVRLLWNIAEPLPIAGQVIADSLPGEEYFSGTRIQRYVEDPLSEALIARQINEQPAFLEVYLENNQLFYRPVSKEGEESETRPEGILLYSA